MKKLSKVVCLLLTLSLLFLCITACGQTDEPKPSVNKSGIQISISLNYDGAPSMDALVTDNDGKVAKPTDPTREGYKFDGWFTNVVCTKAFEFSTDLSENTSIRRLYAGWKQSVATVKFDLGGGLFPAGTFEGAYETTAEVDKKLTLPTATPYRGQEGDFTFVNWCLDPDCTQDFDPESLVQGDMTLYAKWRQNKATYTIFYYDNITQGGKADVGTNFARPADPTHGEDADNYSFTGWFSDKNCTTPFDFEAPIAGDFNIYAGWNLVNATVQFSLNQSYYDAGDDTYLDKKIIAIGGTVTAPADPRLEGLTFVEWCGDKYGNTAFDFTKPVNVNTVVYAKWTVTVYDVTFEVNGGTGEFAKQTVQHGKYATEPATEPTKAGNEFAGWFDNEACSGTAFLFDATPITATTTLYAKWTSTASSEGPYAYTFYTEQGGAAYDTQSIKANKKAKEPTKPTKNGYYFAGWYDGDTEYNFNTLATKDMNLYAKWLKVNCFEAEYTEIPDDKRGQGSSDNVFGTQIIQYIEDVTINGEEMGISNRAYVGKLYYNGAFVEFKVNAAEECDVVIMLRLTPDIYNFTLTDEQYYVMVNGTKLKFGQLVFNDAYTVEMEQAGEIQSVDLEKRPFENYVMPVAHLNKGDNVIRIQTNNSNEHGGTYNADTPLLDCIYVCADVEVGWAEGACHPENYNGADGKRTMADVDLGYLVYEQ